MDAAYVDAELLVASREGPGTDLLGPPWPNPSWQGEVEDGHTLGLFEIDWEHGRARCPPGKLPPAWKALAERSGAPYVRLRFRAADCGAREALVRAGRAGPASRAAPAGGARGVRGGSRQGRAGCSPRSCTGIDRLRGPPVAAA